MRQKNSISEAERKRMVGEIIQFKMHPELATPQERERIEAMQRNPLFLKAQAIFALRNLIYLRKNLGGKSVVTKALRDTYERIHGKKGLNQN